MQRRMALHFVHSPYTCEGMVPVVVSVPQFTAPVTTAGHTQRASRPLRPPLPPSLPTERIVAESHGERGQLHSAPPTPSSAAHGVAAPSTPPHFTPLWAAPNAGVHRPGVMPPALAVSAPPPPLRPVPRPSVAVAASAPETLYIGPEVNSALQPPTVAALSWWQYAPVPLPPSPSSSTASVLPRPPSSSSGSSGASPVLLPAATTTTSTSAGTPQPLAWMPPHWRYVGGSRVGSPQAGAGPFPSAADSVAPVTTPASTGTASTVSPRFPGLSPSDESCEDLEGGSVESAGRGEVEDPQGSAEEALPSRPRCGHTSSWKRLRGKRGCGYYTCRTCGAKWKTVSHQKSPTQQPSFSSFSGRGGAYRGLRVGRGVPSSPDQPRS
eukprot:RCo001868